MRDELAYILNKWEIDLEQHPKMPVEIPNTGRADLAKLFGELGYKAGAEIGTEYGIYAEQLCISNHGVKLYCVDYWDSYPDYRHTINDGHLKDCYASAAARLKPYGAILLKKFSMKAVSAFKDKSLDFVYIDANHEMPWVMEDIVRWSEKVRPGGIVSGHDYIKFKRKEYTCHVIEATNLFTFTHRIRPWFLLGTKAKIAGQTRDDCRSWFWVKE